jgi:SAM-dependent methyltransferase
MATRQERLQEFVAWAATHVRGDEKGEAHIFLDRLFQGFGQKGSLDVGGTPEFRVRKAKEDGGGTAFADYVWKPIVLIEMKRRGENLARHFRQAFDYWVRLVPGRPRYTVLCNFDEFWIYDFETQIDAPVDQVRIEELPERFGPLAFLFPTQERPTFGNDHVAVTRSAADKLATCFNKLVRRKDVTRSIAQRFILQTLVALFSEDIGLLERYTVIRLIEDCKQPRDTYDLLGGLFEAMNTPGITPGGRFKGVDYFNGGLFAEPARLELHGDELNQLHEAAKADWSKVRPEIFGTLFEHSLGHEERHAYGAHFTSPVDIMKIVSPTIVDPWRELIENAESIKRLAELRRRLEQFTVLDPACGSGNFLYVAYREMKRLEARILERIAELSKREEKGVRVLGFVTASQFYGMDINPFAVELAKVTMMIARKLAVDELHMNERTLPLDNLDTNFSARDALIDDAGTPSPWPKADVVIGNPPFLGAKLLKPERGPEYVNAVRKAFPEVPGMADYCVYWFRRAQDQLPACTPDDPVSGRAGLVGTQNIRNNKSRVGGLDHIAAGGTIVEAVDNQPWSGEANVHVSIVNWVKHAPINGRLTPREHALMREKLLIPEKKRLWSKVESPKRMMPRKRGSGPAAKEFELQFRRVSWINADLSDETDVTPARILAANTARNVVVCQGVTPGHSGFLLSSTERHALVTRDPKSAKVIFPYLVGREMLASDGTPSRWVIDFGQMPLLEAKQYAGAFGHVERKVLPELRTRADQAHQGDRSRNDQLQRWWMHWRPRRELIELVDSLPRFMVCSRVTKRPVYIFIDKRIRPGDALQCFAFEDDYSFGILQSQVHWRWFVAKCSKLKSDFRYTPESVFDTFPWPQAPKLKAISAVAKAGREVRRLRKEALTHVRGGLREIYRTLELPGKDPLRDAHAALDDAVVSAYGFSQKADLLGQLLALNLEIADHIDSGRSVTGPGLPVAVIDRASFVSDDCARPR